MSQSKSVLTKYENVSAFSGSPSECRHHLLFGNSMRDLAEQDGIWIPLLHKEHNLSSRGTIMQVHSNPAAESLSKIAGQLAWERQYLIDKYQLPFDDLSEECREAFRKRYGISYL